MSNPNQRKSQARQFEIHPAKFTGTSLLIGIVAPSGAGKTVSSLELAKGIQVVTGGPIGIVDTENERALHYAEKYQFALPDGRPGLLHVPFHAPFAPSAYQAAYKAVVEAGIKIVITDSMTHEHDGTGGVLEMHEEDLLKMKDPSAWGRGKGERRELTEFILQARGLHWIFCYRAREKMRWISGQAPEARGLMPLGNESFIYETTISFLLPAGANGVPVLSSPYPDEELILKLPGQYRHLFTEPRQLSAALGTHLAAWAVPSWKGILPPLPVPMKRGQSASVGYSATQAKTLASPTMTLDELIQKFETITEKTTMTDLRAVYDTVRVTASASDMARLTAAKDACFDRLDPTASSVATQPTVAAPIQTEQTVAIAPAVAATVADIVALYNVAKTREEMKSLRPQYDAVYATASLHDRQRMQAAGNAAADRTSAAPAWGLVATVSPVAPAAPAVSPVDRIISLYGLAPTREAVRELRPQFDAIYDGASESDRARMNAAGRNAVDRLVAAQTKAAAPTQPQAPAQTLQTPTQASTQAPTQTPQAPVQSQSLIDPALEAMMERHAEGMAAFRSALDSFGPEITQEQAAQLVIDHMSEDAKEPKVSPEDGPTAQAEIMARVVPKFASKASLGVMVRHANYCAKHSVYKAYCDDLAVCTTAMNVFECWKVNGKLVDSLPDEVKKEARLRTGKRVEMVDDKIPQGGVWLTKKIKEAREAAGGGATTVSSGAAIAAPAGSYDGPGLAKTLSASSVSTVPPATLGGMGAGVDSEAQTSAIRQATTNGNGSADIVRHAPIESDLGQRLALEIDGATVATIPDIKPKIERVILQKKLPANDGTVLLSLWSEKLQELASA